jgi:rubrerythrin
MNAGMQLNLLDALRDEAFSFLRYQLFARRAHESGRENLAHLFETTARAELEHFSELAQLYRLVGDDAWNLESARKGEEFEVETMYPSFADHARTAGESALAERFEEIRGEEKTHRDAFAAALAHLESPMPS